MILLSDRQILEVSGLDSKKFLQGLITNDIYKIESQKLIYSAMLNNQGRFLYDFFIFEKDNKIFLDCFKDRIDEILKKLSFYKLKADVNLKKNEEIKIYSHNKNKSGGFLDPRNEEMGYRIYSSENFDQLEDISNYHKKRISLKIAESEHDLTYDKSIILEFEFDNLNSVDYEKGCYVGQELTARTHHLGQIRKKLANILIKNLDKIEKNHEIYCQGKKIGLILSSVKIENDLSALALIRIGDENLDLKDLKLEVLGAENEIKFIK